MRARVDVCRDDDDDDDDDDARRGRRWVRVYHSVKTVPLRLKIAIVCRARSVTVRRRAGSFDRSSGCVWWWNSVRVCDAPRRGVVYIDARDKDDDDDDDDDVRAECQCMRRGTRARVASSRARGSAASSDGW